MMKGIGILVAEWVVTGMIVYAGLCGRKLFFIDGPRSAVIMLGLIGFTMCMVMPTIGKFISNAPAHPLTIMGYILVSWHFLLRWFSYLTGRYHLSKIQKMRYL